MGEPNEDLEALETAEGSEEGAEQTDVSVGDAAEEEGSKEPLDLDGQYENLDDFVHRSFNDYSSVSDIPALGEEVGKTIIIGTKKDGVRLAIIDSVDGNKLNIKPSTLSEEVETVKSPDPSKIFVINSTSQVNLKGDYKSDLWKLMKATNEGTDASCRIGAVLLSDDSLKSSEQGKELQEKVQNYFKNEFGIEVQTRWSNTAGKVQGSDSEGFVILAKNPAQDKMTELFRAGSYHHNKRQLFELELKGDSDFNIATDCDTELKEMIEEVAAITE